MRKTILASELKEGDIFTDEIKLQERISWIVESIGSGVIICTQRSDTSKNKIVIKRKIEGYVILLRNINE